MCGWARRAARVERAVCESLKAMEVAPFSPIIPARTRVSLSASSRRDDRSYTPSAAIVISSATRLVSMKPRISFVRIERSRKRGMDASGSIVSRCSARSPQRHQDRTPPRTLASVFEPRVGKVPDHGRLDLPDVAGVLADGAVGGELAHAGDVEQRLAAPLRTIEPGVVHAELGGDVGVEVGQVDVLVAGAGEFGHDGAEEVLVAAREVAGGDRVDDAPDVALAEVLLRA